MPLCQLLTALAVEKTNAGYDRNYIKENSIHLLKALKGTRRYILSGYQVRVSGGEEWEECEMGLHGD